MTRMRDFAITNFKGLNEVENDISTESGLLRPEEARRLEAFRPDGGMLVKVRGSSLHSKFSWKAADRPTTLIRWAKEDGTPYLMMTAWDMLFLHNGAWADLLKRASHDNYVPTQLLEYYNRRFDHLVYNNVLYLTDGSNRPLKYDGSNVGTWGYKKFESTTHCPIVAVENRMGAPNITGAEYTYNLTLYDSVYGLEGNIGVKPVIVDLNVDDQSKAWVYIDPRVTVWNAADNYDYENGFADKVRIYRKPNNAGAGTDRYLASTIIKGLVTDEGTIEINNATGVVTGTDTKFGSHGVSAGDALYCDIQTFQILSVTGNNGGNVATVVDPDGTDYSGVAVGGTFRVSGGFLDADDDIETDGTMYFNDEDSEADHSVPEWCKYCVVFGARVNRAFMAGDANHPNRLYFSEIDKPDYFPLANYIDIDPDESDEITALIKFQGRLHIFKRHSVTVGHVDGDPYTWSFTPKALSVGGEHRRCIADCGGILIFANQTGIYSFDGGSLACISDRIPGSNIRELWQRIVKYELIRAEAVYHKERNEYWISACFDDPRGMYDDSKAGKGQINEDTPS